RRCTDPLRGGDAVRSGPMAIWHDSPPALEELQQHSQNTLIAQLGIEFTAVGEDSLTARMPVDARTHQPAHVLHGGASVALAETLASWAATFVVDREQNYCVGLEINANHVRAATSGWVIGTARPVHLGRSTHVWEVKIVDEREKLVCISRVTMAVL